MIKKILISIGVLSSFFLMFLFGFDEINILAYETFDNSFGSYSVKLDIENYETSNLFNINAMPETFGEDNSGTVDYETQTITITNQYYTDSYRLLKDLAPSLKVGETYSLGLESSGPPHIYLGGSNYVWYNNTSRVITQSDLNSYVIFYGADNYSVTVLKVRINEGNTVLPYEHYFEFGYNVHYSLVLNNSASIDINAGIGVYSDYENNILLFSNTCTVPANSSGFICDNSNDPYYLPFNIDNNGYVSFNYNLTLFVGPVSNITIIDGGLAFKNVYNAYYKGEKTDNLYFKNSYVMNNLYLSGFSVNVNSTSNTDVYFPNNSIDNNLTIKTNNIYNISTDKKTDITFNNYFNYNDFITSSPNNIYDFAILVPNQNNAKTYNINISSLMTRVINDTGNVAPLPNNDLTINKYNSCSAWYDIPCQLGNAVTYVIYEAPIISPVLTFIVSFITMFSSLVSFVDLFSSFGVVFTCFVIYMFIELLHKYSK